MEDTLLEIIELSRKCGLDPVEEVKDYLAEKDSRVTWQEARRIVERLTKHARDGQDTFAKITFTPTRQKGDS